MSLSSLIELHPSDAGVKKNVVTILTQRDTHISLQLVFGMMLCMGYHRVHGVIAAKHGILTEGQPADEDRDRSITSWVSWHTVQIQ